jgi:hypothetical protein
MTFVLEDTTSSQAYETGGGNRPTQNFGKPWKVGKMLGKIKKIQADLSENMLNAGYFIAILHKNSGKLSTAPPPPSPGKHQPRTPIYILISPRMVLK